MQESRKRAGQNGFLQNPHPPKTRKMDSMLGKLFAINRSFKEHINAADAEGCFEKACLQYTEYMQRLRREYPETWASREQTVDNGETEGAITGRRNQGAPLVRMVAHQDAMNLDTKRGEDSRQADAFTPSNPRAFASTGGAEVGASFSFPVEHQDAKTHSRKSTPFPGLASKTFKGVGTLPQVVESPSNPRFGMSDAGGGRDVGATNANATGGLFGTQPTFGFGASQNQTGGLGVAQVHGEDKNLIEHENDAGGDPGSYGGEEYEGGEEDEERPVSEGGDAEYDEEHEGIEQEEYETEDNGGNVSDLDDPEGQGVPTFQEQEDGGEGHESDAGIFEKQGQGVKPLGITRSEQGDKPESSDPKPLAGFGSTHGGFGSPGVKPFSFNSQDTVPTPIAFGSPHSVKSPVTDSVGSTPLQFGVPNPTKAPVSSLGAQSTFGNPAPPIFGQTSPVPIGNEAGEKKKIGESILKSGMSTGGFGDQGKSENKKVTFGNGVAIFRADKVGEGNAAGTANGGNSTLGGGILGGMTAPSSSAPAFGSQPVFGSLSSVTQRGQKSITPMSFGAGGGGGGGAEAKPSSSGFGGFGTGFGSHSKPLFGSPGQSTESTGKITFGQSSGPVFGNSGAAGGFAVPSTNAFAAPKVPTASSQPSIIFGAGQSTGPFGAPVFGNTNPSSGLGTFSAPTGSLFGGGGAPALGAGQASEDEVPKEKPAVEVKDNETWEVKSKAKSKLYRQADNAWKQVGVGCVSVRVKKAGDRAGKGYLMFTTDSGNVLMCTALYSGMQVIEKDPKRLVTAATFLEKKINAEDPIAPKTEESWVSSQALIQVAKPEIAQELKHAIELLKEK